MGIPWGRPRSGWRTTRLARGRICRTPPPASAGPGGRGSPTAPADSPSHPRFPAEARAARGPQRRRREGAGPPAATPPEGEEHVGRPGPNPRGSLGLTRPGAARGSTRATTPETGPERPRPLCPGDFRPLWAVRRLGRLGGSQPSSPVGRRRGQIVREKTRLGSEAAKPGLVRGFSPPRTGRSGSRWSEREPEGRPGRSRAPRVTSPGICVRASL